MKRTNEPVFWGLFGAGGMFTAICAPALILVLLLLPTFGGTAALGAFFGTTWGRLFLWLFISLSAWCGLHRIVHCLHDLKLECCKGAHTLIYLIALLVTVLALYGAFATCG
ncbi:MAG: fumarate reductase subunit D [Desulfovibrio sp.]|jgi:fumarate reductase subunit D|nr:fumarate reductase subunit D [Desulfovibrio sp.]